MKKLVFLGGDQREAAVMRQLLAEGNEVSAFAFPVSILPSGAIPIVDARAALAHADACVMPLPPFQAEGFLYSLLPEPVQLPQDTFADAAAGLPLLAGSATEALLKVAPLACIYGMLDVEGLALPLAEATAEGAIAEALRLGTSLLLSERALILGYGRIGRALAWRLDALGMAVTVMNRSCDRLYQAAEYGFPVRAWSTLPTVAAEMGYIFNTAPAPILTREILAGLRKDVVIIDLASKPGGTDFAAAKELELTATLAASLPGKYAPRFAGKKMAEVYCDFLHQLWGSEKC